MKSLCNNFHPNRSCLRSEGWHITLSRQLSDNEWDSFREISEEGFNSHTGEFDPKLVMKSLKTVVPEIEGVLEREKKLLPDGDTQ